MANFPFQRLQAELAALISNAAGGQRLPSEPALARQLGVSRATLREAMRTFEAQGLIRRRQGAGTFVVGHMSVLESGLEVLESVESMAARLGLVVTISGLDVEHVTADQSHAEGLGVPLDSPIIRIRRVVLADGRPVAYLEDALPDGIVKAEELPASFHGSVLDFLLARGEGVSTSRANISAIGAPPEVAKALEIQRGDVLLHFNSQIFDGSGRVLTFSFSYFIPGYFNFHVVRRVAAAP